MPAHIVVIGAGVVGLTTALKAQDSGHQVTIIAERLPGDEMDIKYTSYWAGAHHVSHAEDEEQRRLDQETFNIMWRMSEPNYAEECFLRITQTEHYMEKMVGENTLSNMPDYHTLKPEELIPGAAEGCQFTTFTIDTPVYLKYLLAAFKSRGGEVKNVSLQHISQAMDGAHVRKANALIVCAGLGARFLGGVEDQAMYPIRGQTVIVKAPWIKFGRTRNDPDLWTYIIPRRSGEVILGGTKIDNDWYPVARPETAQDILERTLAICPELCPEEARVKDRKPTVDDIKPIIIGHGCGLRPARKGGIRIEREDYKMDDGRIVPIVHNYGHGGMGYQSSWGTAIKAIKLLDEALKETRKTS